MKSAWFWRVGVMVVAGAGLGLAVASRGAEELGPPAPVANVAGGGAEGVPLAPAPEPRPAALAPTVRPARPTSWRFEPAPGEFRGAWLHWQDYRSPQAIARTVARARNAGLNVLLPLANYPHQAMWQSALVPLNPNVATGFDPIRELVRQAHAAGIQIHPYLVMLHGGLTKHPAFQADWYARDAAGRTVSNWLDPSCPEVREFLSGLVCELALAGVDGVHYDYIRHEYDSDYGYGEATRRRFLAEHGFDPLALRQPGGGGSGMRVLRTAWHRGTGQRHFAAQQAFLSRAGYRPAPVEEDNLPALRRDTLLVCGNLYDSSLKPGTVDALLAFVSGGGAAIVLDGPIAVGGSRRLAEAVGIEGRATFDETEAEIHLLGSTHPIAAGVGQVLRTRARGNPCPRVADAEVVAVFADGTPAVTTRAYGRGAFVVFNFNCYESDAAYDPGILRLFANAVEWLCDERGIVNGARVGAVPPNAQAIWDQWRVEQVSGLVREITAAARAVRPDLVLSAAGGTQRSDIRRVRRDGLSWLRRGDVYFLCPMAYTSDNDLFRRRLDDELAPVDEPRYRQVIFAGIGAYKMKSAPERVAQQVQIARAKGLRGVCFFAFEDLTDAMIAGLRTGPFAAPAPVPWRMVREGD